MWPRTTQQIPHTSWRVRGPRTDAESSRPRDRECSRAGPGTHIGSRCACRMCNTQSVGANPRYSDVPHCQVFDAAAPGAMMNRGKREQRERRIDRREARAGPCRSRAWRVSGPWRSSAGSASVFTARSTAGLHWRRANELSFQVVLSCARPGGCCPVRDRRFAGAERHGCLGAGTVAGSDCDP